MPDLQKYVPLNFALLANPINWVIIVLMIAIAGLSISLLFHVPPTAEG